MNNIFSKLPENIIIENIIPYIYKFQDKSLLSDIRSFNKDYDLVDSIYSYSYKEVILLNDLKKFVKSIDDSSMINAMMVSSHIYSPFFTRNIMLKNKSITQIAIWKKYFYESKISISSKNRLIWGLMTPKERTSFFNKFILEDDE